MRHLPAHTKAVLEALIVTVLWSSSWVLIKIGLEDMPALVFAGLRYVLAFLCLLPFAVHSGRCDTVRGISRARWLRLVALGLVFYAVTQGGMFLALSFLRSVTVSLFLSFTPALAALLGIPLLDERPTAMQWGGIGLFVVGAAAYFVPQTVSAGPAMGFVVVAACLFANAGSSILGREMNRDGVLSPLVVTTLSMGVGSLVLLCAGLVVDGWPSLNGIHWLIIGYLAVVNTAFAFTLWNHTLRTLSATESSLINNTMLIQIAVLAWVFLGEHLGWQEIAGLVVAAAGALLVQVRTTTRRGGPPG
jgi:drug/metabolite transporter (DMT)-like permease